MPTATRNLTSSGVPPLQSLLSDPRDHFRGLLKDIRITLGPNNGITASDAVRLTLQDMLEEYQSDEVAWQKYAFRDPAEIFTRNLVDRGNGNYNLVCLRPTPMIDMAVLTGITNSLCWFGVRDARARSMIMQILIAS